MMKRLLPAGVLLAAILLVSAPGAARSQSWLDYRPGGIVNWYFGDYPFVHPWQNHHWPSGTSHFTYGIGDGTYKVYYPSADPNGKYYYSTPKAGIPYEETTALLEVKVPVADADIWFEGVRTLRSGLVRQFRSPPLVVGRAYKYEVLALWNEGGREVKQSRFVTVRPGDRLTVEFVAGEAAPEPKKSGR